MRISEAKLVRSMSRKGCSQDNAACEGFFGRLKTELLYPRDWKAITIKQFVAEVDAYIRWYNEKRIKIPLESLSAVEYRKSLDLIIKQFNFLSASPTHYTSQHLRAVCQTFGDAHLPQSKIDVT